MTEVLQMGLPYDPMAPRALPGIQPLKESDWLIRDEAFEGQMAERDRLLDDQRAEVLAMDETARPAAEELLSMVQEIAWPGTGEQVARPGGVTVRVDREDPLGTLGRLAQEDFCILQKHGDEHVLSGAVLCFPASWKLSEKFMRPLIGIHDTVESYDAGIAARVQRLFNGVQVGRPMWRFNALWYADSALHQPRSIHDRRSKPGAANANFLRSERQCILRLPQTGAVIFSIHTYVLARENVQGTTD